METSGATRFKLPIMAAATHNIVVSTNAFRGSPFLDVFAKVSRNGTTPSPAIAYDNCPQMHVRTYFLEWWCMSWYEVTSKPMVLIQWCLYAIELEICCSLWEMVPINDNTWSRRGEMIRHCIACAIEATIIPSSVRMERGNAMSLTTISNPFVPPLSPRR